MLIHIRMQTGKIVYLIMKHSDTILSVKHNIHATEGVPSDSHQLMYDGKVLDNACTLTHYEIQDGSTMYSIPVGIKGKMNTKLFKIYRC